MPLRLAGGILGKKELAYNAKNLIRLEQVRAGPAWPGLFSRLPRPERAARVSLIRVSPLPAASEWHPPRVAFPLRVLAPCRRASQAVVGPRAGSVAKCERLRGPW